MAFQIQQDLTTISDYISSILSPQSMPAETYFGYVHSTEDAMIVFEACKQGQLQTISRRLNSKERKEIRSGAVFVFDEHQSGIKRWTDGKIWSPSRILDNFLVYREVDRKAAPPSSIQEYNYPSGTVRGALTKDEDEEPSGPLTSQKGIYYFKNGGLIKKTISINITRTDQMHMVCYYRKSDVDSGLLKRPQDDPKVNKFIPSPEFMELQQFRKPPNLSTALKEQRRRNRTHPYLAEKDSSSSSTTDRQYDEILDAVPTPANTQSPENSSPMLGHTYEHQKNEYDISKSHSSTPLDYRTNTHPQYYSNSGQQHHNILPFVDLPPRPLPVQVSSTLESLKRHGEAATSKLSLLALLSPSMTPATANKMSSESPRSKGYNSIFTGRAPTHGQQQQQQQF